MAINASFRLAPGFDMRGPVSLNATPTVTLTGPGQSEWSGAVSGNHGLTIDASTKAGTWAELDLAGTASNSYTGVTTVQGNAIVGLRKQNAVAISGDLTILGNSAVGSAGNEQIADTATLTVNSQGRTDLPFPVEGFSMLGFMASLAQVETVGALQGHGTIGLGNGKLVVGQGSFSGTIGDGAAATQQGQGLGRLEKTGPGTLTLSGANTYTGGTALKGGTLAVGNNSALGTGGLAMDDGTTLAFAADNLTIANPITMTGTVDPTFDTGANTATLTGGISGAADLTKTGTGTLILGAANNTYTGSTTVAQGTLRAGVANAFAPASATTIAAGATLDLAGHSQTLASVNNAGTVSLAGSTPGTVLTVTGPWVGNNGTLAVATAVGNDGSPTDRLVLSGASAVASGSTRIAVTNIGGLGAQTTGNGIAIVTAENGGSIGAGAFTLATPVSAGAYDYRLNTTSTGSYLTNLVPVVPTDPVAPTNPNTPAAPAAPAIPTYRADVPLYAALPEQLRQSNLAMLGNLHQRTGDDGGTGSNSTSLEQGYRQAWGRVISIDRDIQQSGTVSPTSSGRLTGFQAGTDLWANANWRTGVYVGQLEGDMSVTGFARGVVNYAAGSNDLRSQYLGAYATWKNDSGLYVDGVLQAGRHRYTTSPTLAFSGSGKGDSLLASIEVGQAFAIAPNWTIEPQLQLVHQRLSLDDTSITGAWVHQNTDGGWMARAGVRIKGEFQTGMGTLQPYARVNVYKRSSGTDTTSFIGPAASTPILTRTGGTSSEVALGATWQLSQSTSLYGELGKLWASGGDARTKSGVNGSLGVKVRW
ncbi:autotransporter outer membrane beta-barrel domain-containing protein [Xenophilus aerolatus]|nr:autotransporter outer membrane beta-barrel domain-containing protein [Xenophilus aerolatus]